MKISIKNLNINYEIIGEGKPIVLIHGYYPDHRLMSGCMEPIFSDLSGYKRIYIDLPGMGQSQSASWIKNSDMMLDIVIEFINIVIPEENFLLCGESYGGYIARGITYKIPKKVDGLFLLCPCIVADYTKRNNPQHIVLKEDPDLLSSLEAFDAKDFNSMAVVQSEKIWQRYRDEILCGVKMADDKFLTNLKNTGYEFSFDVDRLEAAYDKPTLMLLGRQDSSVGYKDAWNILDNYPRATFAVLDMAGHNLQIEQEAVFNTLVKEWLERIEKIDF
ncbi:alpha/beta fold hydrolase [Clostridium manihotivorum]|uniref:2-hydroxy-6-oxo-6-phenylhexa-2,4-dienoate hydrolase n=1 Tax=Clostridium manihotivorum TaxID=2320868 RepID=A0A410DYC4_9CLOT|nr:alpha/beta hydrolase [Clostridium manihotivorum]QAA34081.1 2-hydroxy-6-oxo-6-phenylhexa-2,4-dienoate hydrolase [Clostridium manihotivorum]